MKEEFDDLEEEYEVITIEDEEGVETSFVVISTVTLDNTNYLLVLEAELLEDDEADASILKEISEDGDDIVYVPIEDDEEFLKVVKALQDSNEDYDIEI